MLTIILLILLSLMIIDKMYFEVKLDFTKDFDDSLIVIIYYYWRGERISKLISTNIKRK